MKGRLQRETEWCAAILAALSLREAAAVAGGGTEPWDLLLYAVCALALLFADVVLRRWVDLRYLATVCVFCHRVKLCGRWLHGGAKLIEVIPEQISHGYCPNCCEQQYGELLREISGRDD